MKNSKARAKGGRVAAENSEMVEEVAAIEPYSLDVAELIARFYDYERQIADGMMRDDFASIKTAYPDVTASCIADLGEEFCRLIVLQYDPVAAYEAVRAKILRETKNPPPCIGSVGNTNGQDKDYYSSEEVDRLTREDFKKNPRLLEVVRKSMLKWNN